MIFSNSLINFNPLFTPNQQTEQWLDNYYLCETSNHGKHPSQDALFWPAVQSRDIPQQSAQNSKEKPRLSRRFLGATLTSWPCHDLTRLALSTLSLKGKNASELRETAVSLAIHCFFSASVNCTGTSSNIACHFTRSSSCKNKESQLSPKAWAPGSPLPGAHKDEWWRHPSDTQLSCAFCSCSSAAGSFVPGILKSPVVVGTHYHHRLFWPSFNSLPSPSSPQGFRDSFSPPLIPRCAAWPACSMLLCVNASTRKQDLVDDLTHDRQQLGLWFTFWNSNCSSSYPLKQATVHRDDSQGPQSSSRLWYLKRTYYFLVSLLLVTGRSDGFWESKMPHKQTAPCKKGRTAALTGQWELKH